MNAAETNTDVFQGESVESIVDKYMTEWDYTYEKTFREITRNFEMAEHEILTAVDYLKIKYYNKREPLT